MATRGAVGFCVNFGRTFVLLPPKKHEQHSEKRRCCSGVDHFNRLIFKRCIYYIYIKVCDGGSTGALWRRHCATEGGAESCAPLKGLTKQLKDISDVFAMTRNIL